MKVSVTLELERNTLVWPPQTRGRTTIQNDSPRPLTNINSEHQGAGPALLVLDATTRAVRRYAELQPPGAEPMELDVAAGAAMTTNFSFGHRIELPGPGRYELASEYSWEGGTLRSAPVRVQVRPAQPRAISCASVAGGRGGDLFVAWRNDEPKPTGGVWLSRITTTERARFIDSRLLADSPRDAVPLVSIPASGQPGRQCVVWRNREQLEYAIHARTKITTGRLELGEGGHLCGPPLEDPHTAQPDPDRRGFEILWIRPNQAGWALHLIPIASDRQRQAPTQVHGPSPTNVLTTYDRNGARTTWFLRSIPDSRGQPTTELSATAWPLALGLTPRPPTLMVRWRGQIMTASVAQRPDDSAFGVALINGSAGQSMIVHRWRSGPQGFEELDPDELGWPSNDPIEFGVLRVAQDGRWYALVRSKRGAWGWCQRGQSAQFLPAKYADVRSPLDIFFVDGTIPALVYTRARCGLCVHMLGLLTH